MSIERMVLAFAGCFILISIALSLLFSPYWLLFTAFVGANLLQSAFTGFCPLAKILKAFGANRSLTLFSHKDYGNINGVNLLFLFVKHCISWLRHVIFLLPSLLSLLFDRRLFFEEKENPLLKPLYINSSAYQMISRSLFPEKTTETPSPRNGPDSRSGVFRTIESCPRLLRPR